MEFDLLAFVLGCMLGAIVGYRVADRIHKAVVPDLLRRAGVTPEKLEQVMVDLQKEIGQEVTVAVAEINIKIEAVNGQLYVYRKETSEFLAQGTNYDEILNILKSKFTDVKFAVTKEDGAELLGLKENPTA
jgi:uncharacterized protein YabE (DUF348 family)